MEIVNTTNASAQECINFLLNRGGLRRIIGPNSCACFVVSRPLDAPLFFDELVNNITTIDSTTRNHIAFVVFYGESSVYARASSDYKSYQKTEVKLDDISFSTHCNFSFDDTYATFFRAETEKVNRNLFSQSMTNAADVLMERFKIRERDLPCLLFIDPVTLKHYHVKFPDRNLIDFLYRSILSPLADAFRDLEDWKKTYIQLVELHNTKRHLDKTKQLLNRFSESIKQKDSYIKSLQQEISHASKEGLSVNRQEKLGKARRDSASTNLKIKLIRDEGLSNSNGIRLQRLHKQKYKNQQRVDSLQDMEYVRQLKGKLNREAQALDKLFRTYDRQQRGIDYIPSNLDKLIATAHEQVELRTAESKMEDYDWLRLVDGWPAYQKNDWTLSVGPRAFGVVKSVLPQSSTLQSQLQFSTPEEAQSYHSKEFLARRKILIVSAYPRNTARQRLGEEVRDIGEGLARAKYGKFFKVIERWAVRPRDLHRAILEESPQIIHFSGRGHSDSGIYLENEVGDAKIVSAESLARLFQLFSQKSNIECVVLNGCCSDFQSQAILGHVPYVIKINEQISSQAAIDFSVGFYDALGHGESVKFAFESGRVAIVLNSANDECLPVLLERSSP